VKFIATEKALFFLRGEKALLEQGLKFLSVHVQYLHPKGKVERRRITVERRRQQNCGLCRIVA
jgi:hypothetical protein